MAMIEAAWYDLGPSGIPAMHWVNIITFVAWAVAGYVWLTYRGGSRFGGLRYYVAGALIGFSAMLQLLARSS